MPIYEYQCQDCGKRTEALQKIGAAPLTTCPHCNGPLKKLISSPAFQFKGSGWYVTDYARKGGGAGGDSGGAAKEGGSSAGDKGEKGGAAKSEPSAKPAAAESKSSGSGSAD